MNQRSVTWGQISHLMKPAKGRVLLLAGLAAFQALTQVALAVVTRFVIDAALAGGEGLIQWGIVLAAVLLTLVLVYTLSAWLTGSTGDRCIARLRHKLLGAAVHSENETLHAYHSGALLSRGMEDVRTMCDGVVGALPNMVGQITRLAGAVAAVFIMYPRLVPVLLIASALVAVVAAVLRPVLRARHKEVRQAEEQVMSGMQENLQQLELIRSIQAQDQVMDRFDRRLMRSLSIKRKRRFWSVGSSALISFLSQVGTGVLLLWGAGQVAAGALSYGSLTALLQLLSLFRGPVLGLSGLWTRLASVEVAAQRLVDMLNTGETDEDKSRLPEVHAVVFEDVTFCYPDDDTPVLDGFCARFPISGWTCLSGFSGRGKSTLFKLILGLYAPQQGRVYLETDQGPVLCSRDTRQLFAYVPQDYALFSGTILENLLLAAPDATEQQRREALHIAQADFVWELSAGEQTQVRENNAGLSKGQLQRLAIARAVLMDRPVFLLDECTSALDHETEALVLKALSALGRTAILVTHRPEALEDIDHMNVTMEK